MRRNPLTNRLWLVVLLCGIASMCAGCTVAWNTVEEGAIENHFGSSGKYTLDAEGRETPPAIGYWSPEGYPGFWMDLKIVQGSEAATDAKVDTAASVAATGQGQATGGAVATEKDNTETETKTTETGSDDG